MSLLYKSMSESRNSYNKKAGGADLQPLEREGAQERFFELPETPVNGLCLVLWKRQPPHLGHVPGIGRIEGVIS